MAALTVVNPIPQFFELDGDPLDGGKLYFGVANQNPETSPIPVYWDAAGTIPAAQPVRTSNGYPARAGAPAVLYASTDYSLLVRDKRGRVVFFASNSADFGGSATLGSDLANTTDPAKGPALVGFGRLNYPADTVGGAVFTTVFGDGVSDRTTQLAAANALGLPIRIKGVLHLPSAVTITVPILDTTTQIFTPASFVTIDNGLPVRPEWFGSSAGNIARAVNALPFAVGGTVKFANATYPPSYNTATAAMLNNRGGAPGVDYMVRKRIRFQGDRLPQFNAGETALENGTIIQGPLFIGAECDGFQVDNIGVDSGTTVVNALYAGVEQDGFCIVQTNKTTPITGTQFQIGSVIGLCKLGSTAVHAVLLEAMNGGSIGYAEGRRGYHGVAYKSRNMVVGALVGHG